MAYGQELLLYSKAVAVVAVFVCVQGLLLAVHYRLFVLANGNKMASGVTS